VQPDTDGLAGWAQEPGSIVRRGAAPAVPAGWAVVVEVEAAPRPTDWEPHAHATHELVWVRGGTLAVRVDDVIHAVPEGSGLWLPAGTVHGGRLTAGVELLDAVFAPERCPIDLDGPRLVAMTPVLESLLRHLARTDLAEAARRRAEAVVFDLIEPATDRLALRIGADEVIAPIVRALLDEPGDRRGLAEWARTLETSERTIARAFRRATGLTFVNWRGTLRVQRALELLAAGWDVGSIADALGYAQPSTFIESFRRVMGTTPGAYRGRPSGETNAWELSGKP
jgi:AraC-like DNA-binding protein/quercetin dioxygenase-like cupin family protein